MKLRPKWGMHNIILRFGVLKVLLSFGLFFLVAFIDSPILVVIALAVRTFFNGYTIFNTPILYLSIDEDELKNGSRREGMFLGINALINKPAQSIGPIIATIILGMFGYIQNSDIQPDSALLGIKILMFLVPAIVSAIGLIFMYFYPLHGEKLNNMREKLEILHAQKRERLE
jgi:GPH family glycoside/pentoside/hexuronide:cation symporter